MGSRMRATHGHTRNGRSHERASSATMTTDTKTGSSHQRHRVDLDTGMYRGRSVIDMTAKVAKQQAKAKGEEA